MMISGGAALLLAGCQTAPVGESKPADTLRRAMDSDIKSLDPQKVSDLASLRVAADQFDGLTRFDGGGRAIGALATRWSVAADGRTWTFTLDPARRFSDGHPIDAYDWAASFARLRDPATRAPTAGLFDAISDVAAPDAQTVVIRLKSPFPALPDLLAHPAAAVLPHHRIAARRDAWIADRPLVTSGAYRAARWELGRAVTLEVSPTHARRAAQAQRVMWIPIDDALTGVRAFETGQVDVVSEFPAARAEALRARHGDAFRNAPSMGTYYFAFNTRRPPFSDVRVRRALAMTVDRRWIAARIVGAGVTPADTLVPPSLLPGATPPSWSTWATSARMAAAKRLLADAGYGPERPLTFDIRFNSSAEHRRVAIALAAMWRPLGVEARLFNSEAALHFAALRQGDFALARSGWNADFAAPENFLSVHRCDAGPINYSGFCDTAYEKIMAEALAAPDAATRARLMKAADHQLIEAAPVLTLYHYASRNLVAPRVTGWRDNAGNVHPSWALGLAKN